MTLLVASTATAQVAETNRMSNHDIAVVIAAHIASEKRSNTNSYPQTYPLINIGGKCYTNATVSKLNCAMAMVTWDDSGVQVAITNLPLELQRRYGYDAIAAQWHFLLDDSRNMLTQQLLDKQKTAAAEALSRTRANQANYDAVVSTKVCLWGRIIQKMSDGTMLVDAGSESRYGYRGSDGSPGAYGTCLLIGYSNGVDGELLNVIAYPDGEWTYTTVTGASKTVRRFQLYGGMVTHIATPDDILRMTTK